MRVTTTCEPGNNFVAFESCVNPGIAGASNHRDRRKNYLYGDGKKTFHRAQPGILLVPK